MKVKKKILKAGFKNVSRCDLDIWMTAEGSYRSFVLFSGFPVVSVREKAFGF